MKTGRLEAMSPAKKTRPDYISLMVERSSSARRSARAARMWARVVPLGGEPKGDVLAHSTAAERLALVEEIGEELRQLAGRGPAQRTERGTPIRIIPLSEK